jgi:cell division protein FtsZ
MISIKMQPTEVQKLSPKIFVVGVGGAGGNGVDNMIGAHLDGCNFLVCNTDAQALQRSYCDNKVQLGVHVTGGLGAGSKPEIGRAAAEESIEEVMAHLDGANMVFITAGMGGGTGTGAAPVIAKACRERGILTVGVVTKPFHFEGSHRMKSADKGIEQIQDYVDTLIVIPNQNLFRVANEKTTFAEAFQMADSVLQAGVRGVTDLMVRPGLVNLDFADIRTAMLEMGKAMMGTGEATGDKRAIEAAEAAINNPLLDDVSMKGAHGVIINVTGGYDMTLFEADEACNRIRDEVDPDANIIFGATFDETLEGKMRVSIVATGIEKESEVARRSGNSGSKIDATSKARLERAVPETVPSFVSAMAHKPSFVPASALTPTPVAPPPAHSIKAPAARTPAQKIAETYAPRVSEPEAEMFEQQEFSEGTPEAAEAPQNTALRGTVYNNAFIPPKPAEAPSGAAPYISSFHGAHVPESALAQTATGSALKLNPPRPSPQTQGKRSPSLFERITGSVQEHIGGLAHRVAPTDSAPRERLAPSAGPSGLRPSPIQSSPSQGSLDIDAPARPAQASEEDLDIPAFLRRQAN